MATTNYHNLPTVILEQAKYFANLHTIRITYLQSRMRPMHTAREIIARFDLIPLTIEGGYFRETYRAPLMIAANALPGEYTGDRNVSTCIYYLLTPETFSAIHIVKSDEIFHFYAGDRRRNAAALAEWRRPNRHDSQRPCGRARTATHRPRRRLAGMPPRPRRLLGAHGLHRAPGFDYADFELGDGEVLRTKFPQHSELISALTK